MPELPEVETVCLGLAPLLVNQKIIGCQVHVERLRSPLPFNFAESVIGTIVTSLYRRGKYIIMKLDNEYAWIIHLGMSGQIRTNINNQITLKKHDHVVWQTNNHTFIYNDPRRFGQMSLQTLEEFSPFKSMGLEPFDVRLNAKTLHDLLKNKTTSIKAALLDQNIIAGLGNIYISEALWQVGISPLRLCNKITLIECGILLDSVKTILKKAIDVGGTTLRDHRKVDGQVGYFQNFCQVYGQNGKSCQKPACAGIIQRINQGGRGSFFCNTCQK